MIILKYKDLEAGLTSNGACLFYFRKNGVDILRPLPAEHDFSTIPDPLDTGYFPCVPYFGRIAGGVSVEDAYWPLSITHQQCDSDHAIHGEGWLLPWQISYQNNHEAKFILSSDGHANGKYPFAWQAEQTVKLNKDGLTITLTVTNKSNQHAPFGLALHPFFPVHETCLIQFQYESIHTPQEFESVSPAQLPFNAGSALPNFTLDHSFKNFGGTIKLTNSTNNYQTTITSNAPYLHVFAPENQPFFCLEPITQLPGAYSDPAMLRSHFLPPNQSTSITMTIQADIP